MELFTETLNDGLMFLPEGDYRTIHYIIHEFRVNESPSHQNSHPFEILKVHVPYGVVISIYVRTIFCEKVIVVFPFPDLHHLFFVFLIFFRCECVEYVHEELSLSCFQLMLLVSLSISHRENVLAESCYDSEYSHKVPDNG